MPPQVASRFTLAEAAALAVIAQECAKDRDCLLTLGHIAALAGRCKRAVRNAVREAQALGVPLSDERRLSAFRSAPITSALSQPNGSPGSGWQLAAVDFRGEGQKAWSIRIFICIAPHDSRL